tara:strand:- start:64 stop:351 length:288 start_codon:yes stop_codon:yes gene_type:complete
LGLLIAEFGSYGRAVRLKRDHEQVYNTGVFFRFQMGVDPIYKIVHCLYMGNGPKHMVPYGKDIPIVTISMGLHIMMVYFMEMGCDEKIGEKLIYS